jgi:histidinol phosphatase-like enzyme
VPESALFVDRPALLLIESLDRGQPQIHTNHGALEGLVQMSPRSYRLFFVGNEDSLAFERVPEKKHQRACARIQDALAKVGIQVTADYTCAWAMNAAPGRRRDSVFRLPNVGAMKAARLEYDVKLDTSWILSDRAEAMLAGSRAGVRTALIRSPRNERRFDVTPDLVADDLGTAMRFLNRLQLALTR